MTRRYPRDANPEGKVFLPMTMTATKKQGLVDDLLSNIEQLRFTGWQEAEWRRHFETKGKLDRYWKKSSRFQKSMEYHRYFSDLCSLKICSLYHVSKPDHCTSPSWEVFRPVHAMTRTHSAVMDQMDFEESFLRNSNAAYYNSPHNQILPSKCMFWLQNVKNSWKGTASRL